MCQADHKAHDLSEKNGINSYLALRSNVDSCTIIYIMGKDLRRVSMIRNKGTGFIIPGVGEKIY